MSAVFILKKEPPKKYKFFIFLTDRYFVIGSLIDMIVCVFLRDFVGFIEGEVLQFTIAKKNFSSFI